jgi:hypothetical protein
VKRTKKKKEKKKKKKKKKKDKKKKEAHMPLGPTQLNKKNNKKMPGVRYPPRRAQPVEPALQYSNTQQIYQF